MKEYIRHDEGTFQSLTKNQKEAVGLLSIGTFLEYFDLMIYVHMAVLLNELFFPKADPHTTTIYSALAFCSTYVLRPFGALVFGWIGDNIGRKATVIITTFMMAFSCIIIATLPTYEQIGITATYIISICRIIQSLSSLGEIMGTQVYLTELTKPPLRYFVVALILSVADLGGMSALAIASFTTIHGFNWRIVFLVGAVISTIGIVARTTLRETPEFADAKLRVKKIFDNVSVEKEIIENNPIWKEKINKKTAIACFFIYCGWPICFYLTYIHCGNILKISFGFTAEQVIRQNLLVSIIGTLSSILLTWLSYKIYPLKILKVKLSLSVILAVVSPYMFSHFNNHNHLLLLQISFILFWATEFPATPILLKHFPVFKRLTYPSLLFALSRACMYVITSFGIIYVIKYFNNWGLYIITLPVSIGYWFALNHFLKLEKEVGNYL